MKHSNLHSHTLWSDGKNTQEEMLLCAIGHEMVSYGVSDHSETPFDSGYCMATERIPSYREEALLLKKKYESQIEYYCGLEKDYFSAPAEGFDYVIGSVHYVKVGDEFYSVDGGIRAQERFFAEVGEPMELAKRYYDTVAEAAIQGGFQIQGHFDLVKKYGFFDDAGEEFRLLEKEALDMVLKHVPFIEVNLGGMFRRLRRDPYPSRDLLLRIRERGGRLVINGDSHCTDAVCYRYDETVAMLQSLGFSSVWQLRGGTFKEVPLDPL